MKKRFDRQFFTHETPKQRIVRIVKGALTEFSKAVFVASIAFVIIYLFVVL